MRVWNSPIAAGTDGLLGLRRYVAVLPAIAGSLLLATVAVLFTLMVRLLMDAWLGARFPFLLFTLPICVAAAVDGFGAGAFATALSLAVIALFRAPQDPSSPGQPEFLPGVVLFVAVGLAIAGVGELGSSRYRGRRDLPGGGAAARNRPSVAA